MRFIRRRDAEVIEREVLGHRETVVRLDAVELERPSDARATIRVRDRPAQVREEIRIALASSKLLVE